MTSVGAGARHQKESQAQAAPARKTKLWRLFAAARARVLEAMLILRLPCRRSAEESPALWRRRRYRFLNTQGRRGACTHLPILYAADTRKSFWIRVQNHMPTNICLSDGDAGGAYQPIVKSSDVSR